MEFKQPQPIYLQIADYICEEIISKKLLPNDKVSSVRDLAVLVEVNPNTVVRSYNYLEEKNIIRKERGLGYFVAQDGYAAALKLKQDYFLLEHLPLVFKNLQLLNLDLAFLQQSYKQYLRGNYEKK